MLRNLPMQPLDASWTPNFRPALPITSICLAWLFLLCFTLPARGAAWRVVRLASFPAIVLLSLQLVLDRRMTLGNPLRDLALPILAWTIICKATEICIVFSRGGPRPIRPFHTRDGKLVTRMGEDYAAYEWKIIDPPALASWRRVVYALDVFLLRRVGTSPIRAHEGRALEWSLRGLNDWSRFLRQNRCHPREIPAHSTVRRFGQPEMAFYAAVLQMLFAVVSLRWIHALAHPCEVLDVYGFWIPSSPASRRWLSLLPATAVKQVRINGIPPSAWKLPLPTLLSVVVTVGGAICLLPSAAEGLLLLVWKPRPATSFLAAFERPLTSPGLARLWARSWHATSQRDYLAMASLLPGSRQRTLQLLYVFFWSGVQHSMMFARLRIPAGTPLTARAVLEGMVDPGMVGFFLCQAVGILIETAVLEALPGTWRKKRVVVSLARRAWMYAVLLVPGCMFVHSILQHRLITSAVLEGFSPRALALMLQGKAY